MVELFLSSHSDLYHIPGRTLLFCLRVCLVELFGGVLRGMFRGTGQNDSMLELCLRRHSDLYRILFVVPYLRLFRGMLRGTGQNDFMVELFLRRHSLRQDAELHLYIFLVSVSDVSFGNSEPCHQ